MNGNKNILDLDLSSLSYQDLSKRYYDSCDDVKTNLKIPKIIETPYNGKNWIAYAIFESCQWVPQRFCVYSGIQKYGSTINTAEEIRDFISKKHKIVIHSIAWADLQTYMGYSSFIPGYFQFDQFDDFKQATWYRKPCPIEVYMAFFQYIGEPQSRLYFLRRAYPSWPEYKIRLAEEYYSRHNKTSPEELIREKEFLLSNQLITAEEAFLKGYMPTTQYSHTGLGIYEIFTTQKAKEPQEQFVMVDAIHEPHILYQMPREYGGLSMEYYTQNWRQHPYRFSLWQLSADKKNYLISPK